MKDRLEAARHASEREMTTEMVVKAWQEMTRRFAELVSLKVKPLILEEAKSNACDAFQAMLDAVQTEAEAHLMLQALRQTDPRRPPARNSPLRKPNDPRSPKDKA